MFAQMRFVSSFLQDIAVDFVYLCTRTRLVISLIKNMLCYDREATGLGEF